MCSLPTRRSASSIDEPRRLDVGLEFFRQGAGFQHHDPGRELELLLHLDRDPLSDLRRVAAAAHLDREQKVVEQVLGQRLGAEVAYLGGSRRSRDGGT